MLEINVLKANIGDCFWLHWKDELSHNIVIDSGPASTKREFRRLIEEIESKGQSIDLFILTHIDNDHICGFIKTLDSIKKHLSIIKKIWFNVGITCTTLEHSPRSARQLADKLNELNIPYETNIIRGRKKIIGNMELTVIAPSQKAVQVVNHMTKTINASLHGASKCSSLNLALQHDYYSPDTSKTNEASIAIVLSDQGNYHYAFLGDAHTKDVAKGLNEFYPKEAMKIVKLPHHGSSHNLNLDLVEQFQCNNYILSTSHQMDLYTLSRLLRVAQIQDKVYHIYCNYEQFQAESELRKFQYNNVQFHLLSKANATIVKEDGYVAKMYCK